jgi:uncharacterized membrane protein YbaN (DUF454 family)
MSNNLNKNEQFLRKPIKVLLITIGTFFIGVGIVGIFIPILPTTPFLLISAALYARSSKRFYNWLVYNKVFGRYIKDYREGKEIPLKVKILSSLVNSLGQNWNLLTAAAFISMALPLVLFFSLQRFFVRGVLAGSIKG